MKFFRHYKNKPYKYLGEVKHSETLEDLVLYECLYQNVASKLWVRPKTMFFENVQLDGKETPRFKKIPLEIKTFNSVGSNEIKLIAPLIEKAFGDWDENWFMATFSCHTKYLLLIGYIDNQAVAFKLGYENDKTEFYSWLGAVIPDYRGLGFASQLMTTQHLWCKQQGYKRILTKTQNRFRDMLILNLRHGFDVIGTHESQDKGLKIILQKNL